MRLKKHTDYALRVLMYLAANQNQVSTIKEIAHSFDVSQNHLMKVVQSLAHLGYVKTVRGQHGGLWLGKPAEEIGIGEVLRGVGEQNELAECFLQNNDCRIEPLCKLKQVFSQADKAFFEVLDQYCLADVLGSPASLNALLLSFPSA